MSMAFASSAGGNLSTQAMHSSGMQLVYLPPRRIESSIYEFQHSIRPTNRSTSMDRKLHLLETFLAKDDRGVAYKICGYEHLVQTPSPAASPDHWEPTGVAEYKLTSGEHVEPESDDLFRVAATG